MYAVPRPLLALAVFLLLAAGPMSVLPGAAGQTITYGGGFGDFGWTFPTGDFAGAEVEDASSDVAYEAEGTAVPIGAAPVEQALDLVRFRVDEPDAETIRLVLTMQDLDQLRVAAEDGMFGTSYEIRYAMSGREYLIPGGLWYGCTDEATVACAPGMYSMFTFIAPLYRVTAEDIHPVGYLPTRVLEEESRIEILVPRWAMDAAGSGRAPSRGDLFTGVTVQTSAKYLCIMACTRVVDRLPDEGSADDLHRLTIDSNGARIRVAGGRTDPQDDLNGPSLYPLTPRALTVDTAPGTLVQVPVHVENLVDMKALVVPHVEVVSAHSLQLGVPKSLEVPGRETRKLLITLNGSADFPVDAPLVLRLHVATVGADPSGDAITVLVRTVPTLSPEAPRLYLHTHSQGSTPLDEYGVDMLSYSMGRLNTLAEDPLDDGKGATASWNCFCINGIYEWTSDTGITQPLHLDNATDGVLHLTLDAPVPGRFIIEPYLYVGDRLVVRGATEIPLTQGENVVDIPVYPEADTRIVEPGDGTFTLLLNARYRPADVVGGEFVAIVEQMNPHLRTEGASWLELPLLDPADIPASAAHLSLDLARGADRVQYLNSGRTALWNVTLVNQGDADDTVTFHGDVPDGWSVTFAPGARYRLGSGESVSVGVYATAPAEAAEGATARIAIEARSARSEGAAAHATLTAVVTNGVPIEERTYVADNETAVRLDERTTAEESPFVPVALLLAIALALAWRRRPDH